MTFDATGKQIGFAGGLARFLGMPCYDPPADQTHLLAAEKTMNGVPVHLVVLTAACNNEGTRVGVWVVEEKPMRTGQVRINADELAKRLEEAGAVSIYGIEFDFDKADIRRVSEPVLQEIEKFLKKKADLSLYVVGHTDMEGTLDYNMDLSEKRAAAVVRWLVQHQIAQTRLAPKGLGPLAPKSTNRSDAGRALNRRVELVERRR